MEEIQVLLCQMFNKMVQPDNTLNNLFCNNNHQQTPFQLRFRHLNLNYFNKTFNIINHNYSHNNNFIKIVAVAICFNKNQIVTFMIKDTINLDSKKQNKIRW